MTKILNFSPYNVVKNALLELKENERKVISGRFGVNEERKTLSAIGRGLNLSRERIRQIEKEALKKLAVKIIENGSYSEKILETFKSAGGLTSHEKIAEKFLDPTFRTNKNEFNSLHLIFCLMPQLKKIEKTRELEASWTLKTITKEEVLSIIDDWAKHLESLKKPTTIDVLLKANPHHTKYEITFLSELPHISKKLVKTEAESIGLASWPEVNPKNVRDKIYYILKSEGKPLHFDIIAKKINEHNFSKRKVVRATVHNELIADNRFVLVGRGIYALSEWGYKPGTVEEIIKEVLQKGEMKVDRIVEEVLKQRSVKKNTILINLQTKPFFKKISRDSYSIK